MPDTFRDKAGRTWTPRVDAYAILQLEVHTGVSLFAIAGSQEAMNAQLARASVLLRLLYESVRQQAVAEGVDFEDFCRALGGVELRAAGPVLVAAVSEAFPAPETETGGGETDRPTEDGPGEMSTD